jgi:type VI secretion system ImpJ/VasE family protein
MASSLQVHWHEGLFLQPHHLQLFQRQLLEHGFATRRLTMPYPYGVVKAQLSPDALENLTVQFTELQAVMPSGVEVDVPGNAELPTLNIEERFNRDADPFIIYLALPLWQEARGNTLQADGRESWRSSQMYRIAEILRRDENTGQNPQPVQIRRLNARLVIDGDDTTDMELLPLIRVMQTASEEGVGLPRRDPNYVGPALVLTGSPRLVEMIRDLVNLLETRRRELVEIIRRSGLAIDTLQPNQLPQVLRLRIYNYYAGRLPHLYQAPSVTPFELYLELRGMLGELATLYPERNNLFETSAYDHANLLRSFDELIKKIRVLLVGQKPKFSVLPFVRDGRRLTAALSEDHFRLPNDYFLAVRTKTERGQLIRLVQDGNKFKLMPKSEAGNQIYGIRLQWEEVTPLELPVAQGLFYFRLRREDSGRMWDITRKDRAMTLSCPELESTDMFTTDKAVQLVMTLPEGESPAAAPPPPAAQ